MEIIKDSFYHLLVYLKNNSTYLFLNLQFLKIIMILNRIFLM